MCVEVAIVCLYEEIIYASVSGLSSLERKIRRISMKLETLFLKALDL